MVFFHPRMPGSRRRSLVNQFMRWGSVPPNMGHSLRARPTTPLRTSLHGRHAPNLGSSRHDRRVAGRKLSYTSHCRWYNHIRPNGRVFIVLTVCSIPRAQVVLVILWRSFDRHIDIGWPGFNRQRGRVGRIGQVTEWRRGFRWRYTQRGRIHYAGHAFRYVTRNAPADSTKTRIHGYFSAAIIAIPHCLPPQQQFTSNKQVALYFSVLNNCPKQ